MRGIDFAPQNAFLGRFFRVWAVKIGEKSFKELYNRTNPVYNSLYLLPGPVRPACGFPGNL